MRHNRHKLTIGILIQQYGSTRRAIRGDGLIHFGDHHIVERFGGSENTIQLFDTLLQIVTFRLKLDAAHFRQTTQTQVKNVLCLNLIQIEYGNQLRQCRPSQAEGLRPNADAPTPSSYGIRYDGESPHDDGPPTPEAFPSNPWCAGGR